MTKLILTAVLLLSACSSDRTEPTKVAESEPAPLRLTADKHDLVFRYLDPSTGQIATASSVDDVPAAARKVVTVYDPTSSAPAGYDYVADLSNGLPTDAKAVRGFDFPTPAASPKVATSTNTDGNHEVFLFSTEGCGYCAKARKFLKSKSIPYTELDIETSQQNAQKLAAMGKKAGLGAGDLQGVPIMFVDGKPILGWDQQRLSQLLGLGT